MTRQELYDLVWSTPVVRAAQTVGMSDKGLAGKCKRNGVPLPPRGYWAQVEAGKAPNRTPLDADPAMDLASVRPYTVRTAQPTPAATKSSQAVATSSAAGKGPAVGPFEHNAAVEAELQRAMAASVRMQALNAAASFLDSLALRTVTLDPPAAQATLLWIRVVSERLKLIDPVAEFLESLKDVARQSSRPSWWPPQ